MSVQRIAKAILLLPVRFYQIVVSPWLAPSCRFTPTCSGYAQEAIEVHGPITGSYLAARRLCRCHPWGGSGHDPVPASRRAAGADLNGGN